MRKAAEQTRRYGILRGFCCLWLSCLAGSASPAFSNPSGANVRHGDIRIRSTGDATRIIQRSRRGVIDWNSFSIRYGQSTQFVVPNSRAATLNRVTGGAVSRIDGSLRSNGHVFLLNPNGVVVGQTGTIDVAGFTASTLDVSNEEFLGGGDLRFRGNSQAAVINLGSISALEGDIFLVASTVDNAGGLRAPNGTVGLAAGNDVLIKGSGAERVFVRGAGGERKENGVINRGTIEANIAELKSYGGNHYGMAVKNEGRVAATGVSREGGQIFLRAGGGRVQSTGTLRATRPATSEGGRVEVDSGRGGSTEIGGTVDAGSPSGTGGTVLILGESVDVFEESLILADGAVGGGAIRIGGGRRGLDPNLFNATDVTVGAGTVIDASATGAGHGGEVIVFADRALDFQGLARARGGANGGDGGFIEISGKEHLSFRGLLESADVSAASGSGGTFLLDPTDITIGTATGSGPIGGSPVSTSYLSDSEIQDFLQNNGSLEIETADSGEDTGMVNILYGTNINWTSNNSFSIYADSDINVDSNVTIATTGSGSILLDAERSIFAGGYGSVIPGEETSISTQSGNLTLRNGNTDPESRGIQLSDLFLSSSGGTVSLVGHSRSVDGGDAGVSLLNTEITTGSGSIQVGGTSGVSHGVTLAGSNLVSNGGGSIDVTGRASDGGGVPGPPLNLLDNPNQSYDGIRLDDSIAGLRTTTLSTGNDANIALTGRGRGPAGLAIRFVDPGMPPTNDFVGGDGTQDLAIESEAGDVELSHIRADQMKFNDADGVGQKLTVRNGSINHFEAVNVGEVDVEVTGDISIREIKLATNARFETSNGSISIDGPFDAGRDVILSIDPASSGSFYVNSQPVASSTLFSGGEFGSAIYVGETPFRLEGVSFQRINWVYGSNSAGSRLVDSSLGSTISIFDSFRNTSFSSAGTLSTGQPATLITSPSSDITVGIGGLGFSGFQTISGGGGNDTFEIDVASGSHWSGTLDGGRGSDRFVMMPGGGVGRIKGGDGVDTIDYSLFSTPVMANFGTGEGTQVRRVSEVENVIGGSATDRLIGTGGADRFEIMSLNAGKLNGKTFSGFEILHGVGGNDGFLFTKQGTVNRVLGGGGLDVLRLNDRNLSGVNTYTITNDTISRNPDYRFSGMEVLQLLLGSGDDAVRTRGNGLVLQLDGGRGFDTLEMGRKRFLENRPFQLGGSTVVARNFEAPRRRAQNINAENEEVLTQQVNNVPIPEGNKDSGGTAIDQFTGSGQNPASTMGPGSNPGGPGGFGAAPFIPLAGQAIVIMIDGDQFLNVPGSLDGTFSLPPIGVIEDLRNVLKPDVWKELSGAIDFDGGMILIMTDGPNAIDLTGVTPADLAAILQANLDASAAIELFGALEMAIVISLTSDDGAIAISLVPVAIDPDTAALLAALLADEALAELNEAIGIE